jgi:hypothetical protein
MELNMKNKFEVGCEVSWKWMSGIITGKVEDIYTVPITKEIKGKLIKRNGSIGKPAYLVKSEAGNFALKLHTELFAKGEKA